MGFFMLPLLALNSLERMYGPGVAAVIVFGGCILGFAALMAIILVLDRAAYKRRHLRRTQWGEEKGYRLYDPLPDSPLPTYGPNEISKHLLTTYPHVWFLQTPSAHAFNILAGRENGEEIRIFDYRYVTGSGKSTSEHKYSLVAIQLPRELPALIFRKRVPHDRLAKMRGEHTVTTGNERFDDRFRVDWDVAQVFADRLDDELIDYLSNGLAREYFVSGWQCVVVAHKHISNASYDKLLKESLWFSQWLLGNEVSPPAPDA